MKTRLGAATFLIVTMAASSAWAQTPTPTPEASPVATPAMPAAPTVITAGAQKLKIGGVIFGQYSYDLTDGKKSVNSFDITRAYLNVMPTLSEKFDARVTTDVSRQGTVGTAGSSNLTGSLVVRLKYANLTYHALPNVDAIMGLQTTPWIDFEEGIWTYRGLTNTGVETFFGETSSDFGVTAKAKLVGNKLELHGGGYNGETYAKPETNKYKNAAIRATYQVMPGPEKTNGLRVSAYYEYGLKAQDADRVRGLAMVSYEVPLFTVAGEFIMAQDRVAPGKHVSGQGEGLFGHVNLPVAIPTMAGARVLARVDVADPDTKTKKNGFTRIIAGVAVLPTKSSQLVLDYQQTDPEATGAKSAQAAFVHMILNF